MSNAIIHKAYESTVTSPTDISVLIALADQANDDGICWPSVGSICRRTRLGRRTVQIALRRLTEERHISVPGNMAGGYDRQTTTYVVHPKMSSVPPGAEISLQALQRVHHQLVDEIRRVWEGDSPAHHMQGGGAPHAGGGRTTCRGGAHQQRPNHQ